MDAAGAVVMEEMFPVAAYVWAEDPVSRSGIRSVLEERPEFTVVDDVQAAEVAVVAADTVVDGTLRTIRTLQRNSRARIVLVATDLDDGSLFQVVEAGVCGILRRADASPDRLAEALRTAVNGNGVIPPDLVGRLLEQIRHVQADMLEPRGLRFTGLSEREVSVLRLVAEGRVTAEIAEELAYSERTIKNVIHDVTSRLNLRNRPHAVAYALRQGLI